MISRDKTSEELLAEIERLREENAGLSKAVIDVQEERDLAQAEFRAYHKAWEEGAAWIKELEELNAALMKNESSLRTAAAKYRKRAQAAEAKIGTADECPDDLPPIGSPYRSWQITEGRKAAILHCKRMLTFLKEDDAPCYDVEKIIKDESVLVAMLKEAGQ